MRNTRRSINVTILAITIFLPGVLFGQIFVQEKPKVSFPLEKQFFSTAAKLWNHTPVTFEKTYSESGYFRWASQDQQLSRSAAEGITFFGKPVDEVQVQFDQATMTEVSISLYNRGDSGGMGKNEFQTELKSIQDLMTKVMRSNPKPGEKQLTSMGVRRGSMLWTGSPGRFQLDWGYSTKNKVTGNLQFIAEYVKLTALPIGKRSIAAAAQSAKPLKLAELKKMVSKKPNGDIYIQGVPMVDQGDKGYCAVASAERIFKFYQLGVDQHELAQLAASSAERGTNPDIMMESLKKTGSKLGCRLKVFIDWESDDFIDMLKDYNKLADKSHHDIVPYKTHIISVGDAYRIMHNDSLRAVKIKDKTGYGRFQRDIKQYIESGVPLPWSVILGKVPEKPRIIGFGGHLRLIIGYNPATKELIYTDSWGYGHEYKRMSIEDAWMITMGMYAILPRH